MKANSGTQVNHLYSVILLAIGCFSALLYTGDHIYHLAFVWVSLLFWIISQIYRVQDISVNIDAISVVCVGYLLWLLATYFVHPVIETWYIYTYRLSVFPVTIICSYLLLKERDVRLVLVALVAVGLVDSFVTLYQSFYLNESADGFFANRNNNAAYLYILLLPLFSKLVLEDNSLGKKAGLMLVSSVFLLGILQISSRGAYVGLIVAVTLLYAYAIYRKKYTNLLFASAFVVALIVVNSQITNVELRTGVSTYSRWLLWLGAIDMLKDSAWYGIGSGMFHWVYPQYMNPDERSLGLFVHNDYLQILLELGFAGLVLFASILAIVFLKVRKIITGVVITEHSPVYIGMSLAVLATAIHSLVTFNFYIVSILLVLGIYIGLILSHIRANTTTEPPRFTIKLSSFRRTAAALVMVVAVVPILLKGYADGVSDDFLSKDLANGTMEQKHDVYNRLIKIDPDNYLYPMSAAWTGMVMSAGSDHDMRVRMFKQSMRQIAAARKLNPYAPDAHLVEAQILQGFKDVAGDDWRERAIGTLKIALEINPKFGPARVMLAVLLRRSGHEKQALSLLVEGLAYMHGFGHMKYYEHSAALAKEIGDRSTYNLFLLLIEGEKENNQREFNEMLEEYNEKKTKR